MTLKNAAYSRRDFLAAGVGAAGTFCALSAIGPAQLLAGEAPARSTLRFGLCTYTWGRDWEVPALIANCEKAGLFGLELRTDMKYAHGVEATLGAQQRAEVKKRFADSPVRLVSIACGERYDWPEPEKLKAAIEATKARLILSGDVGCDILRVFPNQFHPNISHEKTIEQIANALKQLAPFAADLGQELSLEAHGSVGELPNMRAIMDRVNRSNVRVRLNCAPRDAQGMGFTENFNLVKNFLSPIVHVHDLSDPQYPYQLMVDLLVKAKWGGWALTERQEQAPADRVAALIEQRKIWEAMIEKAG
jgi:sugar phosphate isomerase/epimerase